MSVPRLHPILIVFLLLCHLSSLGKAAEPPTKIPAFPGAEGFGAYTAGGRGGKVYIVTTLEDYNPKSKKETPIVGSLRWAVSQPGPRIVVFRVAGIIELKNAIVVAEPRLTLAGQSAPGDGICLKNYPLLIQSDDVVVRYMRVRPGDEAGKEMDALGVYQAKNVMVDHCSTSWSVDESLSVTGEGCCNVTVQWCLIAESLDESAHHKGTHGYGSLIRADGGVSFHHNLYAHHRTRCPRPGTYGKLPGLLLDFRNTVIYNWISPAGYTSEDPARINYVGNYLKPGPSTRERAFMFKIGGPATTMFAERNLLDYEKVSQKTDWDWIERAKPENQRKTPFETAAVHTESAIVARDRTLESAGASLPKRDPVDRRIVDDVRHGTGRVINAPKDVDGWPAYLSAPFAVDTDDDGMPDAWELQHAFDARDPTNSSLDSDSDGFTNIEEYLNKTDPKRAE